MGLPDRSGAIPSLDGLRALAVAFVVLSHVQLWRWSSGSWWRSPARGCGGV